MGKPQRIRREYKRQKDADAIVTAQQNIVTEVLKEKLLYDYSKINFLENDKEELIQYEKDILLNKARIGEIALKTGEILENARVLFDRYSIDGKSYMEWYTALGFNKDQVSFLRSRYRLTLDYPGNKKMISELSDAEIKQLSSKKTPDSVVRKVITGEVRTAAGIKKAISRALEIKEDVMEAEIVETEKDKMLKKLSELDSKIARMEEEIKELKTCRAELQEKIKEL